jgi:hypothetical protein|tara:strand:- start:1027 stop:1194 length:168 start_codon:yes stop_codon:yes gene_type:complete
MYFYFSKRVGGFNKIMNFRFNINGGAEGTRTPDILLAKQALSQLSYSPKVRIPEQ